MCSLVAASRRMIAISPMWARPCGTSLLSLSAPTQIVMRGTTTPRFCATIASHARPGCCRISRPTGRKWPWSTSYSSYSSLLYTRWVAAPSGTIEGTTIIVDTRAPTKTVHYSWITACVLEWLANNVDAFISCSAATIQFSRSCTASDLQDLVVTLASLILCSATFRAMSSFDYPLRPSTLDLQCIAS